MVVAGGLLRGAEALGAPTTHASFRQQNAVLAPVRYAPAAVRDSARLLELLLLRIGCLCMLRILP